MNVWDPISRRDLRETIMKSASHSGLMAFF